MAVEGPRTRRTVGLDLHSQFAQASSSRAAVEGNRHRNSIFHDLDAAPVYDAKLHGPARRLGIHLLPKLVRPFDVPAVHAENDDIVVAVGSIKSAMGLWV